MTAARAWPLQKAVFGRLSAALAAAGPDGAPVPVFDHLPRNPPLLFVRLDGSGITDFSPKNCTHAAHAIPVHVFERPHGDAGHGRGMRRVKQLQALIVGALHCWQPFADEAAEIIHRSSDVFQDEDGQTRHGLSQFYINLGD